jgi:hypothetical protein
MISFFKKDKTKERGVIILIAFLSMGILSLLAVHFISFTLTESDMSESESVSNKAYYLAEAGINDAIWKLNNDPEFKNNFLNGTLGESDDILRNNVFGDEDSSYEISFISTAFAEAEIIATSTHKIGDSEAHRVIKTYVNKALGTANDWDCAIFSGLRGDEKDGDISITGSNAKVTVSGSRFHANKDIDIIGSSSLLTINNGGLTAGGKIKLQGSSSDIVLNDSYQEAPTSTIDMPILDFEAWEERATQNYTSKQFKDLPSGSVLNGIIYVSNSVVLSGSDYHLTVNGVLIINGYLKLSGSQLNVTVNYDQNYGGGLLVNGNLKVSGSDACLDIEGLIYTSKELRMSGSSLDFICTGAIIASDIKMSGSNINMDIFFNAEYFQTSLDSGMNPESNIVRINHWEEVY